MGWREQLFILMTLPPAKDSSLIDPPGRRFSLYSGDRNGLGIDGLCNFLWVKQGILRRNHSDFP